MNPNEVVGTPQEKDYWLSPDWSKRSTQQQPGYTKVTMRTVTYRNGRVVTYVLDENHQPITHQAFAEDVDEDVKKAWDAQQGTQTTNARRYDIRQGHAFEWNPATRQYDIDRGVATTEHNPPPSGVTTRNENGRVMAWNPATSAYDVDKGAVPNPQNNAPPTEKEESGRRYIWKPNANGPGGEWQDVGPAAAPKGTVRFETRNGKTYKIVTYPPEANKPDVVTEVLLPANKQYTKVEQDKDQNWWGLSNEGKWERLEGGGPTKAPDKSEIREIDGQQVEVIRDPATNRITEVKPVQITGQAAQPAGPPLPTIVVGGATEALRQYAQQLNEEVAAGRMTPAQRATRWAEAHQRAQFAVQEANTLHAQQSTALTTATNNMQQALSFAENLNKYLPEGSDLGGKAFVSMLQLQMMQAANYGAKVNQPGGDAAAPTNAAPTPVQPSATAAPAPPVTPTIPTSGSPVFTPQTIADKPPTPGEPGGVPLATGPTLYPQDAAPPVTDPRDAGVLPPNGAAPQEEWGVLQTPIQHLPDRGNEQVTTQYLPETPFTSGAPVFQPMSQPGATAPQQNWAVLAAPQVPATAAPTPPPDLHAIAASTPPWKLSPEQLEEMHRAGVDPNVIWSVPGRAA